MTLEEEPSVPTACAVVDFLDVDNPSDLRRMEQMPKAAMIGPSVEPVARAMVQAHADPTETRAEPSDHSEAPSSAAKTTDYHRTLVEVVPSRVEPEEVLMQKMHHQTQVARMRWWLAVPPRIKNPSPEEPSSTPPEEEELCLPWPVGLVWHVLVLPLYEPEYIRKRISNNEKEMGEQTSVYNGNNLSTTSWLRLTNKAFLFVAGAFIAAEGVAAAGGTANAGTLLAESATVDAAAAAGEAPALLNSASRRSKSATASPAFFFFDSCSAASASGLEVEGLVIIILALVSLILYIFTTSNLLFNNYHSFQNGRVHGNETRIDHNNTRHD